MRSTLAQTQMIRVTPPLPARAPENLSGLPAPMAHPEFAPLVLPERSEPIEPPSAEPEWRHGWPVPATILPQPDQARTCIQLPEFDAEILARARQISEQFPSAEAELRGWRTKPATTANSELPHFERVFRLAAKQIGHEPATTQRDYDELLILSAWFCVRPEQAGFLSSYPKALLCPLSHAAPPSALAELSPTQQATFARRAPIYLRYLIGQKFGLRTCADLENADLRQLLRRAGFRLVRASAVAEFVYAASTRGEDPPIRPWKLTLRQELTDDQAADLLMQAVCWQIQYGLRLVTISEGAPHWNIGAFERTDWEDAILSLGVRIPPRFTRESGLLDWRAVLRCALEQIGIGNLPESVLGKTTATPQRVRHDDEQAIWSLVDRAAHAVLDRARREAPRLFNSDDTLNHPVARTFRQWARLFEEVAPQMLRRFGVSAFTALHRVAPLYFGWNVGQLKPWELEQECGKWKGARGRALLRSAYAFALYEQGLGEIVGSGNQVSWRCALAQFFPWSAQRHAAGERAYDFLYGLASRHGLTPLLNREITHTAMISLLAGMNLHRDLPQIENCWELCLRTALERHGGQLEVRLVLPDLAPLPLRLRQAVLTPLRYGYLHPEVRLVRDFDLRLAHETHRKLEEVPGWWDDERIIGTPLHARVQDRADPIQPVLRRLNPDVWLPASTPKVRFSALRQLLSERAALDATGTPATLTAAELRLLLRLTLEGTLTHSNVVQVAHPAIRRGFERLLARDDTREMLDSLLLHMSTAVETEIWSHARKFVVLDAINDLLALTIRCCLAHVLSVE
ncbi:MAG: hypothetical protein M9920_02420 [Verrucomicrobiae bacterium]|nr:hypothetical protein [Verrucomicrobiae bacterium]